MEDYIHNLLFRVIDPLNSDEIESINLLFNSKLGISDVKCNESIIAIDFNPYLISEDDILKSLNRIGISSTTSKKSGLFKHWLQEMEKNNKEDFGHKQLGCCNMNKKGK